jgi:hypothetical protein
VIGNPPYIRIQTLTKSDPKLAAYFKERYKKSAGKGNYDLYVCFVERGIELLQQNGQLAFILPHKFFNAEYGEPLRALLANGKHLRHVVHFGDQQIFPGATNYVCLLFLAKAGEPQCRFVKVDNLNHWLATLEGTEANILAAKISEAEWNFAVGRGSELLERLRAMPVKLDDVADRIFQGLVTGADGVFIVHNRSEERFFSEASGQEFELEPELIHPLLKGSLDIRRYKIDPPSRCILFPYRLLNGQAKLIPAAEFKQLYPKAWSYLQGNRERLEAREGGKWKHDRWYAFGRSQNLSEMEQRKILTPCIASKASFTFDNIGKFYFIGSGAGGGGGYGITLKPSFEFRPEYVLALLNSSPLDFLLKRVSSTFRGGYFGYSRQFIDRLPIRALKLSNPEERRQHDAIVRLVEWLLWLRAQPSVEGNTREHPRDPLIAAYFEQWVNALVYELYFPTEIHATGLYFFELTAQHTLPPLPEWDEKNERLSKIRDRYENLSAGGNAIRIALDKLQTLDLVRIIEGKP